MNKPYRKIEADDDFSMIYIEIGEYTIVADLTSYHGEYSASVWYGNEKPSKVSYGEQMPAMAIKRCKQWIEATSAIMLEGGDVTLADMDSGAWAYRHLGIDKNAIDDDEDEYTDEYDEDEYDLLQADYDEYESDED